MLNNETEVQYWVAVYQDEKNPRNVILFENLTNSQRVRLLSLWLDSARQYEFIWAEMPTNELDYKVPRLNYWHRLANSTN